MTRSEPPKAPWRAGDQLPPLIARTATWGARSALVALAFWTGYRRGYAQGAWDSVRAAFNGMLTGYVGAERLDPTPARASLRAGRWL